MLTAIKMASLEELSSKILKAFEVYGQKLGITLPDAELKLTSTWVQKIPIRNPHFYLSTEPLPEDDTWKAKQKLIKEGLLRHCVPSIKGFYDYLAHKQFPTLQAWYADVQKDSSVPWESVLVYGGRPYRANAVELKMDAFIPQLDASLAKCTYIPPADSFDVLMKKIHVKQTGRLSAIIIEPETGDMVEVYFLKRTWTWDPSQPRLYFQYMKSDFTVKQYSTLSEMGIGPDKMLFKVRQGNRLVFRSLKQLLEA